MVRFLTPSGLNAEMGIAEYRILRTRTSIESNSDSHYRLGGDHTRIAATGTAIRTVADIPRCCSSLCVEIQR